MIVAGNKIYDKCPVCGKLVQLNKFFFGSIHVCLTEEEIKEKKEEYDSTGK
jgi:hypothetical protein